MEEELPLHISVHEVQKLLSSDEDFVLLDCRQPQEHSIVHLPQSTLIPMDEVPERTGDLPSKSERIVVYCHMGLRSEMVAKWLVAQGYLKSQTMDGGIDAWSVLIDPALPRY